MSVTLTFTFAKQKGRKKVKTRMLHLLGADQDTVEFCVTGTGICEQLRQSS